MLSLSNSSDFQKIWGKSQNEYDLTWKVLPVRALS